MTAVPGPTAIPSQQLPGRAGPASRLTAVGAPSSLDGQLAALQAKFPCFRIWRERTCDRDRVLARSLHPGLNPHTVITDDIAELRAALEPSQHTPCPQRHAAGRRS
jgi:hypothetical protein